MLNVIKIPRYLVNLLLSVYLIFISYIGIIYELINIFLELEIIITETATHSILVTLD